jgi:hypothetical protein
MATLTISDAARRCGVTRRPHQRAIHAGRLGLTSDHRLTLEALRQAGYIPATTTQDTPQRPSQGTTHGTPQRLLQNLAPVVERLNRVIELLERLCHTLETQHTAATDMTHRSDTTQRRGTGTPQRHRNPMTLHAMSSAMCAYVGMSTVTPDSLCASGPMGRVSRVSGSSSGSGERHGDEHSRWTRPQVV